MDVQLQGRQQVHELLLVDDPVLVGVDLSEASPDLQDVASILDQQHLSHDLDQLHHLSVVLHLAQVDLVLLDLSLQLDSFRSVSLAEDDLGQLFVLQTPRPVGVVVLEYTLQVFPVPESHPDLLQGLPKLGQRHTPTGVQVEVLERLLQGQFVR